MDYNHLHHNTFHITKQMHKYYVALSARKPSKKGGRVVGDMDRSRRGQWKLLRTADNPAITAFVSQAVASGDTSDMASLRAFLLKPHTGRTHQIRVALKALGSPILGDPMYAAAKDTAKEKERWNAGRRTEGEGGGRRGQGMGERGGREGFGAPALVVRPTHSHSSQSMSRESAPVRP